MPSLEAEDLAESAVFDNEDEPTEKSQSGQIIGIIYPPPEVRSILNLETLQMFTTFSNVSQKTQPFYSI